MKRVAIIGGGISGLSAAFYLEQGCRSGAAVEYTLFEASPRLGGVLKTQHLHDCVIEAGPDSFLSAKPWATELAREVGLQDELIGSNDFQRKTFILNNGRLTEMPDGIQMIVPTKAWPVASSPLLSLSTKLRMAREYVAPPEPLSEGRDESVASFVERHFGSEVVSKLAAPLLAGVYGGDAAQLSARAVLSHFVALESKHRSLVRGVLHSRSNSNSGAPTPIFTSFKRGMQQFVDAVAAQLSPECIALNCAVSKTELHDGEWSVTSTQGQVGKFNHLILALPAYASAELMQTHDADLSRILDSIRYSDSITVALGYPTPSLRRTALPGGFGFLVPRTEGRTMMACTFVQNKFNHRVPDDYVLLRAFSSGAGNHSDAELRSILAKELKDILGIDSSPEFVSIARWPRAMAQYDVGHLEKVAAIEKLAKGIPHLTLIGNAYRGIGIPDCVREGKQAAANILNN
ncbi:MAG: protoporphyrinogen oxidase [Candidatus Angelobacter sp.]|jgi:oxygen-dependent protoporphyrinogen oxidase|nr:protoporphyrinogen oxidase [Candidatus Angelobacter sp.]